MSELRHLVIFTLDDRQYGLDLSCVERIVRAVEITQLPDAPEVILGVINVEGEIVPVINSRKRLSLPERGIELSDHFIIVNGEELPLALVVDKVDPVTEIPADCLVSPDPLLTHAGCVRSIAKLEDAMVAILDVEALLFPEQRENINVTLEEIGQAEI